MNQNEGTSLPRLRLVHYQASRLNLVPNNNQALQTRLIGNPLARAFLRFFAPPTAPSTLIFPSFIRTISTPDKARVQFGQALDRQWELRVHPSAKSGDMVHRIFMDTWRQRVGDCLQSLDHDKAGEILKSLAASLAYGWKMAVDKAKDNDREINWLSLRLSLISALDDAIHRLPTQCVDFPLENRVYNLPILISAVKILSQHPLTGEDLLTPRLIEEKMRRALSLPNPSEIPSAEPQR